MSIQPHHPMPLQAHRKLCVAPMMAYTDRHCRYLHRLAAPHALLFTEMVTSGALVHGPAARLLRLHEREHPVALQLGGSDPGELAAAAAMGAGAGFNEINLNVGCPSPRVRQGRFGACLMREPALVADCVQAMAAAAAVPVTVKCRLGVDDDDSQAFLERFVDRVAAAGCRTFYVHARKALLSGLSPAENRTVPPLDHPRVYALKQTFPSVEIVVNGGITDVAEVDRHLDAVDGVMIGRAAYHQPMVLAAMDEKIFGACGSDLQIAHRPRESRSGDRSHRGYDLSHRGYDLSHRGYDLSHRGYDLPHRGYDLSDRGHDDHGRSHWVMEQYRAYMARELEQGTRLADMTRHMLGLFAGVPGARRFRRILSDARRLKDNDLALVDEAVATLPAPESRAA